MKNGPPLVIVWEVILKLLFLILFISNLLVWTAHGAEIGEYVLLIVFLPLLIITHIISGEKYRKYFG